MAKDETKTGASAPETKGEKKKYIVTRTREVKGPIIAHDGSTGDTISFDEGKPVELTPCMFAGLKDAVYNTTVVTVDEKTGQSRAEIVPKRSYSIEEA